MHGTNVDFDGFFADHLWDKKWGLVLVFAAGLRRHNTQLLQSLNQRVRDRKSEALSAPSDDYVYGSYLLGRVLTNSEASDAASRVDVIRTCLDACRETIPEYVEAVKKELGNIGELAALVGVEQTFLITVEVRGCRSSSGTLLWSET